MNQNELEFQKIYELFQPKILRYLTRMVGESEAEDLTQEVFVKINKALGAFRGDSQLSTWIYRIATNAALNSLRSTSFQRTQKSLSNDLIAVGEIGLASREGWKESDVPRIETSLIRQEMSACIRDFVENLPEDYRTVIVLSELEEFKNTEIAEILEVSLEIVKIRLHRARAKLKRELECNCHFYRDERNELACDLKGAFEAYGKE